MLDRLEVSQDRAEVGGQCSQVGEVSEQTCCHHPGQRGSVSALNVLPVQSLAVGSEKQSWIDLRSVVRVEQVVPSHLAADTRQDKSQKSTQEYLTDLSYLPGGREGLKKPRMFLQYKGETVRL